MSTYCQKFFDSDNYEAHRLTYSTDFVESLISFHKKGQQQQQQQEEVPALGVDVACGTGKLTNIMAPYFTKVIGTDISQHMLDSAPKHSSNVEYIACPAEELSFDDNSVDVLTVATGAHWFDPPKFVNEAHRVLKHNGTLAILGYVGIAEFPKYPQVGPILREFAVGDTVLGKYWDQGRNILVKAYYEYMALLLGPNGSGNWTGVERQVFPAQALEEEAKAYGEDELFQTIKSCTTVADGPVVLEKKNMTWSSFKKFLSTWSVYASYYRSNPQSPDILEEYFGKMMEAAGATDMDEVLEIHWHQILIEAHCNKQQ